VTSLAVSNLGKAYRSYKTEWHRLGRLIGFPLNPREERWVLRHVNFEIAPGEAVGIIGQNGAGKSTLLKLITGTLTPSEGACRHVGRIGAILELGMVFNQELTGRQNAVHAAGLKGFDGNEIRMAIPRIEDFAEIGEYFDEPVRTYSSGMQMRLAFSVATVVRPEILIIDEAMAVGDTYFQHKCFDRIRQFQKEGTTLLVVSHDRAAIQGLCGRAILLEQGTVIKDGRPEEVFDFYNALIAERENSTVEITPLGDGTAQTRSGTGEATVEHIALYNEKGRVAEHVKVGEAVELRLRVKVHSSVDTLVLGYGIKDRLGQVMYGTNTWHTEQQISKPRAGDVYEFVIAFPANLGVGSYSVQTALTDRETHLNANYEWRDLALVFNVVNVDKTHFAGCQWNEPRITIRKSPS
jgi:lipopolysaccharide transport system ATP-binding protein